MTSTVGNNVTRAIVKKRLELEELRDQIEDLIDYVKVLEARARDVGKRRLSHDEVKKRYGLRSQGRSRSRNGREAAA